MIASRAHQSAPFALLHVSSYFYACVLMLIFMCPHTGERGARDSDSLSRTRRAHLQRLKDGGTAMQLKASYTSSVKASSTSSDSLSRTHRAHTQSALLTHRARF